MPLNTERGDAAALRSLMLQPLLNRLEATISRVPGAADVDQGNHGLYVRDGLRGRCHSIGGLFTEVNMSGSYNTTWRQQQNSIDHPLAIRITDLLPPRGRIRRFGVFGYGASGHIALPEAPIVALVRREFSELESVDNTVIGSGSPTPPSIEYYQSPHAIETAMITPHTIDEWSQYQMLVYGEEGANYRLGLTITGVFVEIVR
jgi:hypothetical protein